MTSGVATASAQVRIEQVSDIGDLALRRAAWDGLARSVPAASIAQTFGFVTEGWRARGPEVQQLSVFFAYVGERLAAVWPLEMVRRGWTTAVRLVGSGSREEYGAPLMAEDDPDRAAVAKALYEAVLSLKADQLEFYNVSERSPLWPVLEAERRPKHRDHLSSPIVTLRGFETWEAWAAQKSKNFRSSLRQDRKRLEQYGPVSFREIGAADAADFTDWVFKEKTAYVRRIKFKGHWIEKPGPKAFFAAQIGREGSGVHGYALQAGGQTVAGGLCFTCGDNPMEFFVTTYDIAFEACSPGKLLIEGLVRDCIDRGLDFDFRLTRETYKLRWIDRGAAYTTFIVACSPVALPYVMRRRGRALFIAFKSWVKTRILRR